MTGDPGCARPAQKSGTLMVMYTPMARPLALAIAVLLTLAACTPNDRGAADVAPDRAPGGSPTATTAIAASGDAAQVPPCSEGDGVVGDIPGWPLAGGGDVQFLPVLMSSLVTAGPDRFLYNVLDPTYRQLAAPGISSSVDFYALERDPESPAQRAEAAYLSSGLGRGLYRTTTDFDCVGEWGAEIALRLSDGSEASQRIRFTVYPQGPTPAIGQAVPLSDSLTASTSEEVAGISTDLHPYLAAYDKTVAESVTSGRPSLVFFATPAFCQTGFCGPTVELVKSVAREYEGAVEFVNVEPYALQVTDNGLQPLLDEAGQLQPVQAALDYGIPVEPYLFVVDAQGKVFAKFEGIVGGDELRAAIADVLAA